MHAHHPRFRVKGLASNICGSHGPSPPTGSWLQGMVKTFQEARGTADAKEDCQGWTLYGGSHPSPGGEHSCSPHLLRLELDLWTRDADPDDPTELLVHGLFNAGSGIPDLNVCWNGMQKIKCINIEMVRLKLREESPEARPYSHICPPML